MSVYERLRDVVEGEQRAVLFTVVEGDALGAKLLVTAGGESVGDAPAELAGRAPALLAAGQNELIELEWGRVFCEVYRPPVHVVVVGAVDTAESLCRLAGEIGWRSTVIDARARFATRERLPSAGEIIVLWPEEAFERVVLDDASAVVVLTHDDKFDIPALRSALASDAFYVGALGSRRNQERRRERLLEADVPEDALARISGPCGLDVGAQTPAETAVSILAEILAVRTGRAGGRLQESPGRIHATV